MTMWSITHAYLAVGIAGVAAFVLLLLCGQHHALAVAELGGTEVSAPAAESPKAKSDPSSLQRTASRAKAAATTGLRHVAASVTDVGSGF